MLGNFPVIIIVVPYLWKLVWFVCVPHARVVCSTTLSVVIWWLCQERQFVTINIIENNEFVVYYRWFRSYARIEGVRILELDMTTSRFRLIKDLLIVDLEGKSSKSTTRRIQLPKELKLKPKIMLVEVAAIRSIEGLVSIDNFILNSSTKEAIKFPNPRPSFRRHNKYWYYLGFDADSQIYKVLSLPLTFVINSSRVKALLIARVLTLGTTTTNTWRDVDAIGLNLRLWKPILVYTTYISVDNKIFFFIFNPQGEISLLVSGIEEEKFIGILEG